MQRQLTVLNSKQYILLLATYHDHSKLNGQTKPQGVGNHNPPLYLKGDNRLSVDSGGIHKSMCLMPLSEVKMFSF